MSNEIAKNLGIPMKDTSAPLVKASASDKEADIKYVRENLYDVTLKGSEALSDLVDLAKSSQDFHLYDSLTKLIDVVTKSNIQLAKLALNDPDAETPYKDKAPESPTNINNTMNFLGSTSDMLAQVMEAMAKKKETVIDHEESKDGQ